MSDRRAVDQATALAVAMTMIEWQCRFAWYCAAFGCYWDNRDPLPRLSEFMGA
jgi:hypothetical protein